MEIQGDGGESALERPKSRGDSSPQLYPQLDLDGTLGGNSSEMTGNDVASAPRMAEDSSSGGEDVPLPVPTAPPIDDVPATPPPQSLNAPAVLMQPYTERQLLGLYTNEQMEHNAQFVDMFLTEQASF